MFVLRLQANPVWLRMDIFSVLDECAQNQLLLLSDLDYNAANTIMQKLVSHPPSNPSAYVVSCVKHARQRAGAVEFWPPSCAQVRFYILMFFCV